MAKNDKQMIEEVNIKLVIPHPNNPRLIKDDKFKKLVKSIKEFPEMLNLRPIVVDDNYVVLGGNMRLRACIEAGLKRVPIIKASALTAEQQKRFIITDNVGFGEWDWDMLANEWDQEELIDWGLDLPVMDIVDAGTIDEDDYEVPDGGLKTDIVLGDLFEIGPHRLLCGSSTDLLSVEKLLNGNKIDLVFTDPPYGIKVVGSNGKVGGEYLAKNGIYAPIIGDDTTDTAREFYHTCIALGIENFIIWGGNYFTDFLNPSPCWLIWDKRGEMNSNNFADGEMAWTSFSSPVRIKKQIWCGMIKEGESGKRVHPTQKPIQLCADFIKDYLKGDIVYDGFLGSGSTMVASHQIKKICYGVEMSPDYCQVIIDRMKKLDSSLVIKKNGEIYESKK
jgi:16S rRNA G966 N2-methylase RsmD